VNGEASALSRAVALRSQLGSLLLRDGHLTEARLEEALAEHTRTGRRVGEIVLERGWVSGTALARALAEQYNLEFFDLSRVEVDGATAALLPEKFARRYGAVPVGHVDGAVQVAVADPTDVLASDELRLALGGDVRLAVADRDEVEHAIACAYRSPVEYGDESRDGAPADREDEPPASLYHEIGPAVGAATPAITAVNQLLAQAVGEGASDIHFEPQAADLVVRVRIDGTMRPLRRIPRVLQPAVISRLKVMAALDIAERRAPQDGRISVRLNGQAVDLRMAVLPTAFGEQVVLRIVHRATARLALPDLQMSPEAEAAFTRAIHQPYGAVIACGPTGSGKTTTLYAALDHLNDDERVLTTIEDPVEYQMPGVTQVEVNVKAGLTFSAGYGRSSGATRTSSSSARSATRRRLRSRSKPR
jgi:type IV pilus assembly protein PilB